MLKTHFTVQSQREMLHFPYQFAWSHNPPFLHLFHNWRTSDDLSRKDHFQFNDGNLSFPNLELSDSCRSTSTVRCSSPRNIADILLLGTSWKDSCKAAHLSSLSEVSWTDFSPPHFALERAIILLAAGLVLREQRDIQRYLLDEGVAISPEVVPLEDQNQTWKLLIRIFLLAT